MEDEDMSKGRMMLRNYLERVIRRDDYQFRRALLAVPANMARFRNRGMPTKTLWFLTSLAGRDDRLTPRQKQCGRDTLVRYIWLLLEHLGEWTVLEYMERMGEPDVAGCYPNMGRRHMPAFPAMTSATPSATTSVTTSATALD